jgi:hypothetical protein
MATSNEQKLDERHRLLAIREFLGIRARPEDYAFDAQVVDACVKKVAPLVEAHAGQTGERIVEAIARNLGVHFEEVKTLADIDDLERRYLVEQKELGFGRLAKELGDPTVDALLFQRVHAEPDAPDRWVAVLNLQETQARAYWSRPHELIHRLAEPPQKRLPFFRHRDDKNRIERLIDLGAAELAFPRLVYGGIVNGLVGRDLSWDLIDAARHRFAPTASLLSAAKAFLRHWPHPAYLLTATVRGRRSRPHQDVALRIGIEGFSPTAERSDIRFFPNMRVPSTSPMRKTHESGRGETEYEALGQWTTSSGEMLPNCRALTSAVRLGSITYGLVSPT